MSLTAICLYGTLKKPIATGISSEGLRKDESQFLSTPSAQLIEALRKREVPDAILEEAAKELLTA